MKVCPSCNSKCADSIKYCPRCNRYLGNINSILEKEYYKDQSSFSQQIKKLEIECPYCHSKDTKKITATSKAVHTAIFGLFSVSRNSKNFHCNNCNSDF